MSDLFEDNKEMEKQDEHISVHITRTYSIRQKDVFNKLKEDFKGTYTTEDIIATATMIAIDNFQQEIEFLDVMSNDFKIKCTFPQLS